MGESGDFEDLSRREREVMYVVHRLGEVTAESLQREIGEGFSYSGARRYLSMLHDQGLLLMRKDGNRYCYRPVQSTREVGLGLLRKALQHFFNGSATLGMASLLREEKPEDYERELAKIERMLREDAAKRDPHPDPDHGP
jgi:predicted transcriptional regulator